MARVCELGREQGQFQFDGEPAAKAREILAALQGARQLARLQSPDFMRLVVNQIRRDLALPAGRA